MIINKRPLTKTLVVLAAIYLVLAAPSVCTEEGHSLIREEIETNDSEPRQGRTNKKSTTPETLKTLTIYVEGVSGELRDNVAAYLDINRPPPESPSEASALSKVLQQLPLGGLIDTARRSITESGTGKGPEDTEPVGSFELQVDEQRLRWLHARADDNIRRALQPFGYYHPTMDSSLERTGNSWGARYKIDPGPPVRITGVDIRILGEGNNDPAFQELVAEVTLAKGEILDQRRYEDLKRRMQFLAAERGYFDARLTTNEIRIDLQANTADIALVLETGKRYRFGDIRFTDDTLDHGLLRRFVRFQPGDPYLSEDLLALQSDLINSDYFSRVEVNAPRSEAVNYHIPIKVILELRNKRRLDFGVGYGTDTGLRGSIGLDNRWLNRRGHRLNTRLLASQIKYNLTATYEIPGANPTTDSFSLRTGVFREDSDVKDTFSAIIGGSWVVRRGLWERTLFIDYGIESFRVAERDFSRLLIPGMSLIRRTADNPLNVTRGSRLELRLRGAYEPLFSDVSFLQPFLSGRLIRSFGENSRFIVRSDLGTTFVSDFEQLPSSLRFFAGGDNSVRGYELDKISPEDSEGNFEGAKSLIVGSLEYEHRVWGPWSAAVFVDSGDAFNFDTPDLKTGVGLGVRWQSPVGPVRIDFAHALDRPPGDDIRLHFSFGPPL